MLARFALTMLVSLQGSRRQFDRFLRESNTAAAVWKMQTGRNEEASCHTDTINRAMEITESSEFEKIICQSMKSLVKSRALDPFRMDGMLTIAVDGTNLHSCKNPHCEKCLTQKHSETVTTFRHDVLAAKVVSESGFIVPVAFAFVENTNSGSYVKQDCEIKAWRRLIVKLKKDHPRMKFNIVADGLYAEEETFSTCDSYGYNFFITLSDDKLPSVRDQLPTDSSKWHSKTRTIPHGNRQITQIARWRANVSYHGRSYHVLQLEEIGSDGKRIYFNQWITNRRPDAHNAFMLADIARLRWKIENEGTNTQKNAGFEMQHLYGEDLNAMKNYYLLLQLAQLLVDLVRFTDVIGKFGNRIKTAFTAVFGTIRNFAELLRSSLRLYSPNCVQTEHGRIHLHFI